MKQPKALSYFFLTEAWERFGFYIIQTLLVLYMVSISHLSDRNAYTIIGQFTALAYITPILGGYLADRIAGYRFCILLGGILLCAGYAILSIFPEMLLVGLTCMVVGNSLFKPNISSFLGEFYTENDPRRESGFTIFYIGINIGAFLGPVLGGYIQQWFGWHVCFGIASIGLIIATLTFRASFHVLENKGLAPKLPTTSFAHLIIKQPRILALLLVIGAAVFVLFNCPNLTTHLLKVAGAIILLGLIFLTLKHRGAERKHMAVLIVMLLFSVIFWGLFFEIFFSVNLFTDRGVEHMVFGHTIPTAVFLGLEATFIILLGPLVASLWKRTGPNTRFMTTPYKFSYALLFTALAYELLVVVINHSPEGMNIHASWIILFYVLIVMGELFLSPIGLSMITSLTPKKYIGLMMGVWFITLGYGGALGGFLAQDASISDTTQSLASQIHIYKNAFQHFANIGFVAFLVLFFISPFLTRWILSSNKTRDC